MKISKMAPVFDQLSHKLPLQVNAASLPSWLETLDLEEAYYSCSKLLRVMKSLETEKLQADAGFEAFGRIFAVLEQVGAKLEKALLDAGNPVGVSERINAELIIYSYAELARQFWNLSTDLARQKSGEGVKRKVAQVLFNALEALRRGLLYIAFLYDCPYEGFWQLCYKIYLRAESLDILASLIGRAPGTPTANDSIDNSFKSLLVFYLSDTSLMTQREMKALFALFQSRPVPVKVYHQVDEEQLALAFAFAADSDAPPTQGDPSQQSGPAMRYVSTIKVARMAYENLKDDAGILDKSDAGSNSLFSKLAKVLSMKAARKFSRVSEHRECQALFGFNNILNYLTHQCDAAWDASDLKLMPNEDEPPPRVKSGKAPTARPDAKHSFNTTGSAGNFAVRDHAHGKQFIFENIAIVNSSAKDYGLIRKDPGVPVKIGELAGILSPSDGRIEIGMVRRIIQPDQMDVELGLELISLQATIVIIWRSSMNLDRQMVLFLPGIEALNLKDSIIFRTYAFSAGETIIMQRASRKIVYSINRLLHTTQIFTHAELTLIENDVP